MENHAASVITLSEPSSKEDNGRVQSGDNGKNQNNTDHVTKEEPIISGLLYGVTDRIPLGVALLNAIQLMIYSAGSILSMSFIIYKAVCAEGNAQVLVTIISTSLFMCGLTTFLQVTFGLRLPITQGSSQTFLIPLLYMMQTDKWQCKSPSGAFGNNNATNYTQPEDAEPWNARMAEVSGCLALASCVQVFMGLTGLAGFLARFIGPLTVTPLMCILGMYLAFSVVETSSSQWGIALLATFLTVIFTVGLAKVQIPCPSWSKKRGCHTIKIQVFRIFSTMFAIIICWVLCLILTVTDVFPNDPSSSSYSARTDAKLDALSRAPWLFAPYPGQWGPLTFSAETTVGMLAAVLASILESLGDYRITAFVCQVPPPPEHAVNRAVMMEGIGSVLSGAFGAGHATTSYSSTIGYISYTGVASRLTWQMTGIVFILAGVFGKIGGVLALVPDPIAGGMLLVVGGMVFSSGVSALKTVNLELPRNLMILGISVLLGVALPMYLKETPDAFPYDKTGVLQVLVSNGALIGAVAGCVLDNILPGSHEDRGFTTCSQNDEEADTPTDSSGTKTIWRESLDVYDFNCRFFRNVSWPKFLHYVPICPLYEQSILKKIILKCIRSRKIADQQQNQIS